MTTEARPRDRACDWVVLTLAGLLLAAAAGLSVDRTADGVEHVRVGGVSLPPMCVLRALTGLSCPACGVTRSVIACVHGDLPAAVAFHPFGVFVVLMALLQIPYRLALLAHPGARSWEFPPVWRDRLLWGSAALLLVSWLAKSAS